MPRTIPSTMSFGVAYCLNNVVHGFTFGNGNGVMGMSIDILPRRDFLNVKLFELTA